MAEDINKETTMLPDKVKILIDFGIGDGSLSKRKEGQNSYQFEVAHGPAQEIYLKTKAEILQSYGYNANPRFYSYNTDYWRVRFCTSEAKTAYKYLYNSGKKELDKACFSVMDRRSLAYWFFDDGNASYKTVRKKGKYVYVFEKPWLNNYTICMKGMTRNACELTSVWLLEKYGIRSGLYAVNVIGIHDNKSKDMFRGLIEDFVTPDLAYKLQYPHSRVGIPFERYTVEEYHRNRLSETTPIDTL